ncbi:Na+/H+ antiporter NhaA [uncultured Nocardioides sp.]|uniref:Na+/H+ antiporter NhaA n=1 Tax=uncultured Nocardioides sp. TaxID=198441 RepID=UPI00260D6787|nr:Na+/H+ antiporter NhaA [uncultured Nocardioides sp.]
MTILRGLTDRIRTEPGAAALLAVVTVVALVWANTPLSGLYDDLWHVPAGFSLGPVGVEMDLHHWVNDGLMVLFFFLVGLEVRHELAEGSLRDRSAAILPMAAGVAGVVLPVLIYVAVVGGAGGGEGLGGWGVVVGTDTAFLLGALAVVGPAMSNQLRVFLLALTVVDDFLAVAVMGVFYSDDVRVGWLLAALACLGALWLLGRTRQWRSSPYVAVVAVLWYATVQAGVHPSLAGMAAGLLVPAFATQRHSVEAAKSDFRDYWQSPQAMAAQAVRSSLSRSISVNARLQHSLRGPTTLVIVPVFALANAGVDLRGGLLGEALTSSVTWGVVAGLVVGKLLGISLVTLAAVRLGLGRLPDGVGSGSILGGAALSGIGFTVSLLVVELAFDGTPMAGQATVGVLLAMVLALLLGWAVFALAARFMGETTADLPTVLDPPVDPARDHVRGNPDASLTVVEYFDFECPFCARATGMWKDLKAHFGDDLRYVVRHVPLDGMHPHARLAAAAAEAAGRQGRFWEMHDLLFTRQDALEADALVTYADELGLDTETFAADLGSADLAAVVQAHADSAHRSGVRGTPTFFVDGLRHLGPHDARTLIDQLEAARR